MGEKTLKIDAAKELGRIKPLNGVGGGPATYQFSYDATPYFQAANIPICRLHDIEYPMGSGEFVDIHNLFRSFDADENDPANYNFTMTDEYIRRISEAGAEPLFRLGNSIEHQNVLRYTVPPADFEKWGRICSRIIAHYNEGWGNGFRYGIRYWEIWNEPNVPPCWTGTDDEIIALYAAAATIIKRDHPDVKVGGLAFAGGPGTLAEKWLAYCRDHRVPLDFLSWHRYVRTPAQAIESAGKARRLLDAYGFTGAESIYDEWNFVLNWDEGVQRSFDYHNTVGEAAFMGAVMSAVQDNGVDVACYYDVQMLMERVWNGVFKPGPRGGHGAGKSVVRQKGYYPLYYWGQLLTAGRQVFCETDYENLYATAALDESGKKLYVMLSHFADTNGDGELLPFLVRLRVDTGDFAYKTAAAQVTDPYAECECRQLADSCIELRGFTAALLTFERE